MTQTEEPRQKRSDGLFKRLMGALRLKPAGTSREDLQDVIAENATGEVTPQEQAMLKNVLQLREVRVADVMVPRVDIISVSGEASLAELLNLFRTANHSRLPVYGETLDDPRGMIHIRDFLDYLASKAEVGAKAKRKIRKAKSDLPESESGNGRNGNGAPEIDLGSVDLSVSILPTKLIRSVLYVPPSMLAMDLLLRMQSTRTHMALVIDEYGGTDGLVSIEDLVEVIVGDIDDEHDEIEAATIQPVGDMMLAIDARATLEEVSEALGIDLNAQEAADDVDTIGGYLTTVLGRVPVRGEIVTDVAGIEFEVTDADPRRIKRLRVSRKRVESPDTPPGAPAGTEKA
jgi:CBS domain containing-hemolysin-like protein